MGKLTFRLFSVFLTLSVLLAAQGVRPAYAAGYVVNSLADNTTDDAFCTLREAILAANNAPANANCGPGSSADDTITFSVSGTITLGSTLPNIVSGAGTLTIDGGGNITVSGANLYRVMYVNSGANLTLQNITIANGNAGGGDGGGIYNNGALTVSGSSFNGNIANFGGGIYNNSSGTATITGAIISGNSATGGGGGALNGGTMNIISSLFYNNTSGFSAGGIINGGTLNITRSTFHSNNASNTGGGIRNDNPGTVTIANSTFASNSATLNGGGIHNASTLTVNNSTFYNNSAVNGGGIRNANTATIKNTIIANSPSGGNCSDMAFTAASTNNMATDATCGSSFAQVTIIQLNLGALTGSPAYFPLNPGSFAIDAGDPTTCAAAPVNNESQNGTARPQDGNGDSTAVCDIGSYEYDPTPPVVVTHSLQASYTGSGPGFFTVTFSEAVDDPAGDIGPDDVTNPDNYLLIEKGVNAAADTVSCAGGVAGDDSQQTVTSVSYNSGTFTSTVTLAGALPAGKYRLFVCGTTSIVDLAGNPLNGGTDFTFDFVVQPAAATLPATGFPMGRVTRLPEQPAEKAYAATELTLEIPALKVKAPIVGVLKSGGTWDVSWLGNSVGWLEGSAFPTWQGNTVLTGHVWDADNTPGIFNQIKNLKYSDRFYIHAFGQTYVYEVRENTWLSGASRVDKFFKHEEYDWVTLLTCEGYNPLSGNYFFRRMVRAVLVEVK
jgi:LPXTG-site transpeptidase (sortase) family protein